MMGPESEFFTISKNLDKFFIGLREKAEELAKELIVVHSFADPKGTGTYVNYNLKKGTTTLILGDGPEPYIVVVKTMPDTPFDLEKGILYAALKANGFKPRQFAELYNKVVFTKKVRGKKKQFIFSDEFYRYLITHHFGFEEKELDELMSSLWNPEKDIETALLYFIAQYECNIQKESIQYLIDTAVLKEHKTRKEK